MPPGDVAASLPTIRILFYADSYATTVAEVPMIPVLRHQPRDESTEFGLRILKDTLESAIFPRCSVTVLNRYYDYDSEGFTVGPRAAPNKLTSQLLSQFDEVWFFGQHLDNSDNEDDGFAESVLTDQEVFALLEWMDAGGGVLVTGDHSNPPTPHIEGDGAPLLNLGRAMGHRIPRAGELRVWQGPPGQLIDQVNTSNDPEMDWQPGQEDAVPQHIYPVFWELTRKDTQGRIRSSQMRWHPLFAGSRSEGNPTGIIRIFPDHSHEGALVLPKPSSSWPQTPGGRQPLPVVVAHGFNYRGNNKFPLVSAYDGHVVNIGRIVADTTWHHYVDINLHGFRNADGSPGPVLQKINDYFLNLAFYLQPKKRRVKALGHVYGKLARHPVVREIRGSSSLRGLGGTASRVLLKQLIPGQLQDLHELLYTEVLGMLEPEDWPILPDESFLVGGLVREAGRHLIRQPDDADVDFLRVAKAGLSNAINAQLEILETDVRSLESVRKNMDDRRTLA
jgi:hypothetical protein